MRYSSGETNNKQTKQQKKNKKEKGVKVKYPSLSSVPLLAAENICIGTINIKRAQRSVDN